jgi:N-acetylneuraminic acid mutarotase
MPTARNHLLAAAVNGKIYAIGGRLGSAQIRVDDDTNVVEEYDPGLDQWYDKGRAPIRRSGTPQMAVGRHCRACNSPIMDLTLHVVGGGFQSDGMAGVNTRPLYTKSCN